MRTAKCKRKGFTLVELLITMAIMVGVVFAAGGGIALLTRSIDTTNQLTSDNSAARTTMMLLTREVRSASMVEVDGNDAVQNLYLYFFTGKNSAGQDIGDLIMYVRNPTTGKLSRTIGTYTKVVGEDTVTLNRALSTDSEDTTDTGLAIRRFSARVEYDERDRGWLYLRIRADHNTDLDTNMYDQNLMLDTKIALNRLVT